MSQTPSLRPSTMSSLFGATKATTSCAGGLAPPRRDSPLSSGFHPRVSFCAAPVQAVEPPQWHQRQHPVLRRRQCPLASLTSEPTRPRPKSQGDPLRCSPIRSEFRAQGSHHPNRNSSLLSRIPPTGFPVFVHDSIVVSEVKNLGQTRDGSITMQPRPGVPHAIDLPRNPSTLNSGGRND